MERHLLFADHAQYIYNWCVDYGLHRPHESSAAWVNIIITSCTYTVKLRCLLPGAYHTVTGSDSSGKQVPVTHSL